MGENERRVTVYSQQCRALNLIWLLHETAVLDAERRQVAVMGAGAGGLTAAAAAAYKGCDVFLISDSPEAMPLQRFARHRWLHPHIFEWPAEGWWKDDAGLPLLNWKAGDAHSVRQEILAQFDDARGRARVHDCFGVDDVVVEPGDDQVDHATVSWTEPDGRHERHEVDAAVLAVGFGSERCHTFIRPPVYRDSYWDDPGIRWASPGHVLISGGGDGALTEVLHAALGESFEHEDILELAGLAPKQRGRRRVHEQEWLRQIRDDVETFEQRWRHRERPPGIAVGNATNFYAQLAVEGCDENLRKARADGERSAAERITLVVKGDDLAPASCALNRFLVTRLIRLATEAGDAGIEMILGGRVDPAQDGLTDDPPYTVVVDVAEGPRESVRQVPVDSVVIRHGPTPPRPLSTFSLIAPDVSSSEFSATTGALLDASRQPNFGSYYKQGAPTAGEPRKLTDPDVLVRRERAYQAEPVMDLKDLDRRVVALIGAMDAAAVADRAITATGVERIARCAHRQVPQLIAEAFGQEAISRLEDGLTLPDGARRTLGVLPAAPKTGDDVAHDPVAEMLALGHLRAGAVVGACAETDPALSETISGLMTRGNLSWWSTRGYAAARFDHVPTQLAFVQRALRQDEVGVHGWNEAYTCLRRALRQSSRPKFDREQRAAVLIEAADFARQDRGRSSLVAFADTTKPDDDLEAQGRALATLLALKAIEPDTWEPSWLRPLLKGIPRRLTISDDLRRERLPALAASASTPVAADLLTEVSKPEATRIKPLSVDLAWESVAREYGGAEKHAGWLLAEDMKPSTVAPGARAEAPSARAEAKPSDGDRP